MSSASSKGRYSARKASKPATPEVIQERQDRSLSELKVGVLATTALIAAIPITGGASFFAALPAAIATLNVAFEAISPDDKVWY
jgi:hypothetical protein